MRVMLQIASGAMDGQKVHLHKGQAIRVGSSARAGMCVPDGSMSELHFELSYEDRGLVLRDLRSGTGTLVQGEKIEEYIVKVDNEITAGNTKFRVWLTEDAIAASQVAVQRQAAVSEVTLSASGFPPETEEAGTPGDRPARNLMELGSYLELGINESDVPTDNDGLVVFVQSLLEKKHLHPALKVLGYGMPRRKAVWWGIIELRRVLGSALTTPQLAACNSAETWVRTPSEANRRAAEIAFMQSDKRHAAYWLAAAAFWSGNNLAPSHLQPVPIDDRLTMKAVLSALTLAATTKPLELNDLLLSFVNSGLEIAATKTPWQA